MPALDKLLSTMNREQRARVEARTKQLIAEEASLRDVRKALDLSQATIAKTMKIAQANVSQLEGRADLLISTVRGYVEAMGGHLDLIATFKDRPPVKLLGFGDLRNEPESEVMASFMEAPVKKVVKVAKKRGYIEKAKLKATLKAKRKRPIRGERKAAPKRHRATA